MSTLCAISRASAFFIKIPFSAPLPVPTIIAVGVAKPIAQGQAIIKTPIKFNKAKLKAGLGPKKYHIKNVIKAITTTTGTKILAILSANLCIGAFEP